MKRFLRLCRAYVRLYVFSTCPRCKLRDRDCRVCGDFAHSFPGQKPNIMTLDLWRAYYVMHLNHGTL